MERRTTTPAGATATVLGMPTHDSEAEYTVEYPVTCPNCRHALKTVHVVRLLRTRVHFVSTLPRRGHVLTCPDCRSILSGELTIA